MKQTMEWKIAVVSIICLAALIGLAQAQETDGSGKDVKGEIRFRYDFFEVNGDRGRFREDNWMTDQSTGGLDWLHIESIEPDEKGYEFIFEGKALYDYDYDLFFLLRNVDSHYLKLDFSSDRRYFDGSNAFMDIVPRSLGDRSDYDYFVDRRNYNVEFGLTPSEGLQWIFGWHRLVKDGKEVLLGNSAGRDSDDNSARGVAAVVNMRGITDTIYGEVFWTAAEKYNFRIRQEFEQYHDSRRGEGPPSRAYDIDGNVTNDSYYLDNLGYTNWRTMAMFDSFLDDETYVTANYMYNYLNNNGTHDFLRGLPAARYVDEWGVGNSKRTNVGTLGYRKANVMNVQALDFTAAIRVEDSKTSSNGNYYYSGSDYELNSSLDEVRVAEAIRLVYKGIERTTLSFDADLEQRDLDWHARRIAPYTSFDRDTDTDFQDQVYTFKAVRRHNRNVKSTIKFRIIDLERSVTNLYRLASDDYPGWLGSFRRRGHDLTVKTNFRHNSKTNSTLMYQYVQESIDFSLGGKASNREIHRGMGSLSFSPKDNLFLVGTFMLENYDLDTSATAHADAPRGFDYRGNSYTLLLNGTYAFNEKTSCTLGVQHTEALGKVDQAGNYIYDKVALTVNHKLARNQAIGLGYQFYNFENQATGSGDFDDYRAHGLFATYSYTF